MREATEPSEQSDRAERITWTLVEFLVRNALGFEPALRAMVGQLDLAVIGLQGSDVHHVHRLRLADRTHHDRPGFPMHDHALKGHFFLQER
jgi:hypothetical protein